MENIYQNSMGSLMSKVFMKMSLGLLITAVTSFALYSSGLYYTIIMTMPMISLILLLVQIGLTISMSRSLTKDSPAQSMYMMFIVYSVLMGFTMAGLGYAYSLGQISVAFIISAMYFVCLAIIGKTTKLDLSKVGTLCVVGLFAMIISQMFMLLFHVGADTRLWSIVGLLLFTGITAWDIQKMNRFAYGYDEEKLSIYFALELYLDFINIFVYILRLLGNHKD